MSKNASLQPPLPAQKPQKFVTHGDVRIDEYAWLREPNNAEVNAYIEAENKYADACMRPTAKLRRQLYQEIRSRMKEDDMSVPIKDGPYLYYTRTKKGQQYAIHCRKRVAGGRPAQPKGTGHSGREEIILDENQLAKKENYFSLGEAEVDPDHILLAYTVDTTGAEMHELRIKDLRSGKLLPERIESVGDFVWAEDKQHLLYTLEEHPHPPRRVYRHELGTPVSEDVLIYEERDPQWYVTVGKSNDDKYIFIIAANFDSTEIRCMPASEPTRPLKLLAPRKRRVKYYVEHHEGDFYIVSNEHAVNFKIFKTGVDQFQRRYWKVWIPHRKSRAITGLILYKDFFVIALREHGAEEVYVHAPGRAKGTLIVLPEQVHSLSVWSGIEYASPFVRLTYQSLLTPRIVYDYNVRTAKLIVRKKQDVPRWDPAKYSSERVWAHSKGVKVPVSLAYKKTTTLDGTAPMLLEAYGSYGISSDPYFSISKAALLDRGWVVAIAHPRGGGEMGWSWHKQAKLLTKHRTYEDVIACMETLIKRKYAARAKTALMGGSAGGMMVGAVLNMRPDLCGAAVAYVPAADLITSSLDESLGGTRLHYDETGDPRKPDVYRYLKRYSPYENVKATEYPALLVRANMNDIRTPYWEAAKWVARLRAKKTDTNPLLFKTETVAGHFGKSGRYEWIKDRAFDFAFLMRVLGLH